MDQHGAPRFEPTALIRPMGRWVIAVIAALTFIVAVAAMLLVVAGRWGQSAELRAPSPVPENRIGAYLDAVEAFVSRPSAQAGAARAVGVEPSSVEVTITRTDLDRIRLELSAPSARQATGTLAALAAAGINHAGAEERTQAAERLERADTDTQKSRAQADVDALVGLDDVETAELVAVTRSGESVDWVLVLAAGVTMAAAATFVVAHLEWARLVHGHVRTPQVFEVRTRADVEPAPSPDPKTAPPPETGIPIPRATPPYPTTPPTGPERRWPAKHRIAGLEGRPPRPRAPETIRATPNRENLQGQSPAVRAGGARPQRHHYQRRRR
ncbi:MAG: hypothetical protein GY929_18655 [Actinomycetia bacterium]|nr:hypothetical protein [Actinomycetes bacterium]